MGRACSRVCLAVIALLFVAAGGALGANLVAWEDGRAFGQYGFDIYGYDLETGREVAICVNTPRDQADPAISGDIIVWCDWRNDDGTSSQADIYGSRVGRGGANGSVFAVCTSPGLQLFPAISGDVVVWQDSRNLETTGWDIYGYDLSTGEEFAVSTAPGNQVDPAIGGSVVVWTDEREGGTTGSDIRGLDLASGEELVVCAAPGSQSKPAIDGDLVVWEDWRSFGQRGPDVYGYDLSARREISICTELGSQRSPSVSGGVVVWEDWRNDPGDNSNSDIYSRDVASGVERMVSTSEGHQYAPAISGSAVIWEDWRADRESGHDVRGYDLTLNREIDVCSAIGAQGCGTIFATGQLHAHWMRDQVFGVGAGLFDLTPAGLEILYEWAGYDFIAPTEHHPDPKWEGLAKGMFENPGWIGIVDLGDSMEDSCAGSESGASHILGAAFDWSLMDHNLPGTGDRQARLDNIRDSGDGLAFVAHPKSRAYLWSDQTLSSLYGHYDGIEVYNAAMAMVPWMRWQARADDTWTVLLQNGLDVLAIAGDDFTPNLLAALDRACVTAEVYTWWGINSTDVEWALRDGRFFVSYARYDASNAPRITSWWYDYYDSRVRVEMYCPNGIKSVRFFTGSNPDRGIGVSVAPVLWRPNTWEASLTCTAEADKWVRAEVEDLFGRRSLTQPLWPSLLIDPVIAGWPAAAAGDGSQGLRGPLSLDLAEARLEVDRPQRGVSTVVGQLVGVPDRPEAAPPLGYVGGCYQMTPAIALEGDALLSIRYDPAQVRLCREEALAIYRYDELSGRWVAIPSVVDAAAAEVRGYIDRLGMYALSAELGEDVTPPTVAIASPGAGEPVSGLIEIEVTATDDNGVASVEFMFDDVYLGYDTTLADGWSCPLDASLYANGTHTIAVAATDASGNESEASVEVDVISAISPPEMSITWPEEDAILWGEVEAGGEWLGDLDFGSGTVYLGEWTVALATPESPTSAAWTVQTEVPLPWYGPILMTIEGEDTAGNRAAPVSLRVDFRSFSDVAPDFWARNHIYASARAGVVQGYPEGTYQPATEVTRDQMAVYIARAIAGGDGGVPEFVGAPTFPDVGAEHWALDYIEYAVDNGVVTGYDDGSYHPEYEVTRDQMAVYVARAMVSPTGEAALDDYVPAYPMNFADVPATGYGADGTEPFWAYKHIEYCVEQGVVLGYDDGLYHPEWVVTRDQMAVYVARAFALTM